MEDRKNTSRSRLPALLLVLFTVVWSVDIRATGAPPSCRLDLGKIARIEQRLMRHLRPRLHNFFHPALDPEPEEIFRLDRRARGILSRRGVKYRMVKPKEMAEGELSTVLGEDLPQALAARLDFTGHLYRIISLPAPKTGPPTDSVWNHPETQALLDHLREIGVGLYVDATMELTDTLGIYDSKAPPSIRVVPECNLLTLKHEVQHADYTHYEFDRILRTYLRSTSPEQARRFLDAEAGGLPGTAARRLHRAVELLGEGYPLGAIDERLSAEVELETMRSAGIEPSHPKYVWANDYADLHLLNELARVAAARPLKEAERRCLVRGLARYLAKNRVPMSSVLGIVYREYQHSLDATRPSPPVSIGAWLLSLLPRWGLLGPR